MKKTGLFLITATLISASLILSSCNSVEGNTAVTETQTSETDGGSVFPKALKDVDAYMIPEIDETGWELTGGISGDTELSDQDLQDVLDEFGGSVRFGFMTGGVARLIGGNIDETGTYQIVGDASAVLHIVFPATEYYGVFTVVNSKTILVISNIDDPETALYFTAFSES